VSEDAREEFGDPLSRPFWRAAERRQLLLQCCATCGRHQFYPRPFCLTCQSDRVEWVPARGTGSIYSQTRVHMSTGPGFEPPYVVAVVQLDEGPRLVTNIVGGPSRIGDRVRVAWRERADAPPLPVFEPLTGDT
jgi:hypothetical protein